jgi:hypothetical protein
MGAIGYSDGMRFIVLGEAGGEPPPNPELIEAQMKHQLEQERLAMEERIAMAGNDNSIELERMRNQVQLIDTILNAYATTQQLKRQAMIDAFQTLHEAKTTQDFPPPAKPGADKPRIAA